MPATKKKIVVKKKPQWFHVLSFKDPTKEWDEYEGLYVYPSLESAIRFADTNAPETRFHYYVLDPKTDAVKHVASPPPVPIKGMRPMTQKPAVKSAAKKKVTIKKRSSK